MFNIELTIPSFNASESTTIEEQNKYMQMCEKYISILNKLTHYWLKLHFTTSAYGDMVTEEGLLNMQKYHANIYVNIYYRLAGMAATINDSIDEFKKTYNGPDTINQLYMYIMQDCVKRISDIVSNDRGLNFLAFNDIKRIFHYANNIMMNSISVGEIKHNIDGYIERSGYETRIDTSSYSPETRRIFYSNICSE